MTTCPQCGMTYREENDDNRREHRAYHNEVRNGVAGGTLKTDEVVWSGTDERITVVTPHSPKGQRVRARKVAQLANATVEEPHSFGIYDENEPADERQLHLFLYHRCNRIVAFAIFEKRRHVWCCTWDEYASRKYRELDAEPIWSLGFIWVLSRHRRGGVARRLFDEAMRFLKTAVESVGFYTEFTAHGEAFVRAVHPREFLIAK